MRIQHNIMAMNAYRNYNTNTSALSKNLEKLSSGYKINRAGDDAAGLAISEKMRAQITGLEAAQKNVKDGISLVKTAEGAMQEIQDMLNRMDYLATQSANGTYDDPVDRKNLQKEVDALKSEINRIADSANFNGISLLDGSLDPVASKAKADAAVDQANADAAAKDAASFVDVAVSAIHDHEATDGPKKMKFTLDLSEFKAVDQSGTGGTFAAITINTVTGVTVTGTATSTGAVTFSIGAVTEVEIGGVSFSVTLNDNKLTFEMLEDPTSAWNTELTAVSVDTTAETGGLVDVNYGEGLLYHVEQEAVAGAAPDQAQGSFTLTTDMLADGARLTIGDTTYTFAIGKDSEYANADNVVILDNDTDVASAAARLSAAALDNGDFIVGSNSTDGTIKLTERLTDDGKSNADYDLAGTSAAIDNATWKRADGTGIVKYNPAAAPTEQEKDPNAGGNGLTLQIGDTSDSFNQLNVVVGDMHVDAMGAGTLNEGMEGKEKVITDTIDDIDISTQEGAQNAIDVIKNAINYVSGVRGDLGAVQNRLEHTANNLSVMAENIQDAESTIRDTDIAEEMMAYTKNNILVQSAQAMLAQANAVPQGVLQLLG